MDDYVDLDVLASTMYLVRLLRELRAYGVKLDSIEPRDDIDSPGSFTFKFTIPMYNTMSNPLFMDLMDMSDTSITIDTIKTCVNVCTQLALQDIDPSKVRNLIANNRFLIREIGSWDDTDVLKEYCRRAMADITAEKMGR